jgi:cation diffusion facilitator family transporter
MSNKSKIAKLSIISNSSLICIKLAVGIISGSVSVISEAIHSIMDLVAAVIAFISVKIADRPPDENHPYGHEKAENISGVIEAVLIVIASCVIITQAVKKLIIGTHVVELWLGCVVMAVSAAVNLVVSRKLYKVAKSEDSIALEADALHLKADVYTSLGVALGLLIIGLTGIHTLDPVLAIAIALLILKEAYDMLVKALNPLMDATLSDGETRTIKHILDEHRSIYLNIHELRMRRAGKMKHIDLHMTIPEKMTIKEFHEISEDIEGDIEKALTHTKVLTHSEPCDGDCPKCTFLPNCKYRT